MLEVCFFQKLAKNRGVKNFGYPREKSDCFHTKMLKVTFICFRHFQYKNQVAMSKVSIF